ncbi:hypothetical protein PG993_008629 [Apiospora rasikravindrae]|uniref:Uncharacterized protein n=1 Tax=Apiospora rasikravindrae TaxID=990691 RepID=A0ABR1SQP7_9PEZI
MAPIKFQVLNEHYQPLLGLQVTLEVKGSPLSYEAETSYDPIRVWSPRSPEDKRNTALAVDLTPNHKYRISVDATPAFISRWSSIPIELQGESKMITLLCCPLSYRVKVTEMDPLPLSTEPYTLLPYVDSTVSSVSSDDSATASYVPDDSSSSSDSDIEPLSFNQDEKMQNLSQRKPHPPPREQAKKRTGVRVHELRKPFKIVKRRIV